MYSKKEEWGKENASSICCFYQENFYQHLTAKNCTTCLAAQDVDKVFHLLTSKGEGERNWQWLLG